MGDSLFQQIKAAVLGYLGVMERYDWAFILAWLLFLVIRWKCYKHRARQDEDNVNDYFPGALVRNANDRARVDRQLQQLAERARMGEARANGMRGDLIDGVEDDVPTGEIRARLEVLMSRDSVEEVLDGVYHPALLAAAAGIADAATTPSNASVALPRLEPPWSEAVISAARAEARRTPRPPALVTISEFVTSLRSSLEMHSQGVGETPLTIRTDDFDAAVAEARSTNKMLFVLFAHPVIPTTGYFSFVYPHYPSPWSIAEAQSLLLNLFVLAINTRSVSDQVMLFFSPIQTAPLPVTAAAEDSQADTATSSSSSATSSIASSASSLRTRSELDEAHKASVRLARRLRVKLTAPLMILADTSPEVDTALQGVPDIVNDGSEGGLGDEQKSSAPHNGGSSTKHRVLPLQIITWVQTLQQGFHREVHSLLSKRSRLLTPAARKFMTSVSARSLFVIHTRLERGPYQQRPRSPRASQNISQSGSGVAIATPARADMPAVIPPLAAASEAAAGATNVSNVSTSAARTMSQAEIDELLAQTLQEIFAHENSPQLQAQGGVTPLNLSPGYGPTSHTASLESLSSLGASQTSDEMVNPMGESWMYSRTSRPHNAEVGTSTTNEAEVQNEISTRLTSSPGLRPANDFSRIMAQISHPASRGVSQPSTATATEPAATAAGASTTARSYPQTNITASSVLRAQDLEYEAMLQEDMRRRAELLEQQRAAERAANEARAEQTRQKWRSLLESRWEIERKRLQALLPEQGSAATALLSPSQPQLSPQSSGAASPVSISSTSVMLSVRLPDGSRVARRFVPNKSRVADIFLWLGSTAHVIKPTFDDDIMTVLEAVAETDVDGKLLETSDEPGNSNGSSTTRNDALNEIALDWGLGQLRACGMSLIDRAGVLKSPLCWPGNDIVESAWQNIVHANSSTTLVTGDQESKTAIIRSDVQTTDVPVRAAGADTDTTCDVAHLSLSTPLTSSLSCTEAWTPESSTNPTLEECGIVRPLLLFLQTKDTE